MQRFPDWAERLDQVINEARDHAFRWGHHDCGLFVCNCVLAMTGHDPGTDYRGWYDSAFGAARRLKRMGGSGIRAAACRAFGPEKPVLKAHRGDVVLIETDQGPALGICTGPKIAAVGPHGLNFVDVGMGVTAWKI